MKYCIRFAKQVFFFFFVTVSHFSAAVLMLIFNDQPPHSTQPSFLTCAFSIFCINTFCPHTTPGCVRQICYQLQPWFGSEPPRGEAEEIQVLNEGNKYGIECLEARDGVYEHACFSPVGMMGFFKWLWKSSLWRRKISMPLCEFPVEHKTWHFGNQRRSS